MEDHRSPIEQANQALRVAIRTAYLNRDIPLDTTYEVKPLPTTIDQQDRVIIREVWVYQKNPQKQTFKLINQTLRIVITERGGTELEQAIIEV